MAAGGTILLRILLLQSLVLGALCCSCNYTIPQEQFCTHEFVMKARITDISATPDNTTYVIDILDLFRGRYIKLRFIDGRYLHMYMPRHCAFDSMQTGDVYAIFASESRGSLHTDICSGSMKWDHTSLSVKRGLYFYYKTACSCVTGDSRKYSPCYYIYSNHN